MTDVTDVLTRADRAIVLERCLKNRLLIKRCYRYHQLLNTSVEDLLNELGIHIYEGLFYFRFKHRLKFPEISPLEQAYKLALTTGHNYLGCLVRARVKKGLVSTESISPKAASHRLDDLAALQVTKVMVSVAAELVGTPLAAALLRATLYDWQSHGQLSAAQQQLLKALKRPTRHQVTLLLDQYRSLILAQLEPAQLPIEKVDGVWRQGQSA